MDYLYHKVPKEMKGDLLYPLNELKDVYPEVYTNEVKKYEGRENLLKVRIPFLDCPWNDVVHLTAVDPAEIKKALIESGRKDAFQISYFRIDPKKLDPQNTIVYLYKQKDLGGISREDNFEEYEAGKVGKYSNIPEETREYYRETISKGEKPLLYHKIPHILYKGKIDISDLEIFTA